ncbi:ATP-dependent helicase/nuclease subunit B [Pacificibacter maritimus]|uniref:ATP-dependent helicase/nuclease subunit B n=1 Tax=Pacificibacter maritimus TaxID=762213 RepID=A0A3N4U8Q6_9RHOB|nr:double-strand break repair protein AddB [Pacificibacter maritimus]RPE64735.1 ATP-dependent helicase/nuclease subunit B [Pacificibacter maritimus]
MFSEQQSARLFGLPCGTRFAFALKDGLLERLELQSPEALARVEIFVNSGRMQTELKRAFDDGKTQFLPKIRLVTDLSAGLAAQGVTSGVSGLQRRLELSQLVARFLDQEPDFAARSSIFDLSDNLAALLAEMHDEDIHPDALNEINVQDTSGHWARARRFLSIISTFFDPTQDQPPMPEARLKMVVERLCDEWSNAPPTHPIIIAGSTGSRGTTAQFMQLVAQLPQGAVVLPGVDFSLTSDTWDKIRDTSAYEHPQFRFVDIADRLGLHPSKIENWATSNTANDDRNRLVSLALQPAPVTDQWMSEGPVFQSITAACRDLTLIEAPDARSEAVSIALALRKATEEGQKAALITPDRNLARHVTAVLDRWDIAPDDSAGIPLSQTPPGRLLRHVSSQLGRPVSSEQLLVMLKHPLVASGKTDAGKMRGDNLLWTRRLEKNLRRNGPAFPMREDLVEWVHKKKDGQVVDPIQLQWAHWIADIIDSFSGSATAHLSEHLDRTLEITKALVQGPVSTDYSELWAQSAGRAALRTVTELEAEASHGGDMTPLEFAALFQAVIGRGLARDMSPKHPGIMIWGTLEARAQGVDLVILGGLNDSIWPALAAPDPWFSRDMRKQIGLKPPEQQIGLSAHDFQQAIGAKSVILTRAQRNAEAETVASRWLIRLTNLLSGMSEEGKEALEVMRQKGRVFVDMARQLEQPKTRVPAAKRPSPRPPKEARPRQLSVTRIETLVRDPYEIYASRVLRLSKLDPLTQSADPRDRGVAFHKIMEEFIKHAREESHAEAAARLIATAERVLEETVLWPAARRVWLGRIKKIALPLVIREAEQREKGRPVAQEIKGGYHLKDIDFSLTCEADRIDETPNGDYIIYDYKTGAPPTQKVAETLRMQLHLEAMMLENGGFAGIHTGRVAQIAYLGLDRKVAKTEIDLHPGDTDKTEEKFRALISNYDDPTQGYTSRRIVQTTSYAGDFDHLARVGEWSDSDDAFGEDVR